jgi:cytoskeleton protein RodZ
VRNYARLLQLDADAIVAALPGSSASSLDSPTLNPTAQTMGELPQLAARGRAGWARWLIPLTLVAIVAAAAMYEFSRTHDAPLFSMFRRDANQQAANEAASMTGAPSASSGAASNTTTTQALPNPLAGKEGTAETPTPPGANVAPGPTAATPTAGTPASGAASAPVEGETTLSLSFHDKSWTTVKDREGRVLLSKLIPGGQEQTLTGAPPFDLVIGNATEVNLKYRGENIDLSPYIKSGVARLTLR